MKNSDDNVFQNIPAGTEEETLTRQFLAEHDFSPNTVRAMTQDLRKFARWFSTANQEPFTIGRITVRDVSDFRDYLRREKGQAVATVNRSLVSIRRWLQWLVENGHLQSNPAKPVKELKRQALAPKGLSRSEVRKLLREVELRRDTRSKAIFNLFLYTGCRVGDLVNLRNDDLMISERSGTVVFRQGKGNKQRTVPLSLPVRRALEEWLSMRPPSDTPLVFIGERGPLTDRGVRNLCDKYSALCGLKIHPHLLRHTMAHRFLEDNPGGLINLSLILGHQNLNSTHRYVVPTVEQLSEASDRMAY